MLVWLSSKRSYHSTHISTAATCWLSVCATVVAVQRESWCSLPCTAFSCQVKSDSILHSPGHFGTSLHVTMDNITPYNDRQQVSLAAACNSHKLLLRRIGSTPVMMTGVSVFQYCFLNSAGDMSSICRLAILLAESSSGTFAAVASESCSGPHCMCSTCFARTVWRQLCALGSMAMMKGCIISSGAPSIIARSSAFIAVSSGWCCMSSSPVRDDVFAETDCCAWSDWRSSRPSACKACVRSAGATAAIFDLLTASSCIPADMSVLER